MSGARSSEFKGYDNRKGIPIMCRMFRWSWVEIQM